MEPILGGLFVFAMRLTDMSLDTLRMLFVMRGRKLLAGGIGAIQAAVFILAVSAVLKGELTAYNVAGYALGFGAGIIVGIVVEERLAIGYVMFRIYSPDNGRQIAEALRKAGHAATEFTAQGKDGPVVVVNCAVARKAQTTIRALVDAIDPGAFITMDEVRPIRRGYFHS
jgi:uncharacterized protein YebE (UPF0316 family)